MHRRLTFAATIVAALALLLGAVMLATGAPPATAQTDGDCPAGWNLTADRSQCFQSAATSTSPGCEAGTLTPDGTRCYVPATPVATDGTTVCPDGYSIDDSLGGQCARFAPATRAPNVCPDGARGEPGACYVRVATGPAGTAECSPADAAAGGTVVGIVCVIPGGSPTAGTGRCPTSTTVFLASDGTCYQVISPAAQVPNCTAPYAVINQATQRCKVVSDGSNGFVCPHPAGAGSIAAETVTHPNGSTKIAFCIETPPPAAVVCTSAADVNGGQPVNGECRRSVALVPGPAVCPAGFAAEASRCVRYSATVTATGQCPGGSVLDADRASCVRPVADQAGPYVCPDGATVSGSSCVWTTGFLVDRTQIAYRCVDGSERAVVTLADEVRVICITGAPTVAETVGCLRGTLTTDGRTCVLPLPAAAAPLPAFTG